MKTLVVLSHPDMSNSRVNKLWVEKAAAYSNKITIHDLYREYPDFNINVKKEQELVESHDNIIFQFPLYWYSSPSLLKKWIDEVITYGWAYGSKGKRVFYNRKVGLAISAGVEKAEFTNNGKNKHTLCEMLTPFKALCAYINAEYIHEFVLYGANSEMKDEEIQKSANEYLQYINMYYLRT